MTRHLPTIAAELEAAQRDLELYERLQSAAARVAKLTKEHDAAKAASDREEETKLKAAREARFAGLGKIRVSDITSARNDGTGVLSRTYKITYSAPAYDMYSKQSVTQEHTIVGFRTVPSNVLAYLIEEHPEQIPAPIMELAPHDPAAAISQYFVALQRGYVRGKAAA